MEITPSQVQTPARSELWGGILVSKDRVSRESEYAASPQTAGPRNSGVQACKDRKIGPIPI